MKRISLFLVIVIIFVSVCVTGAGAAGSAPRLVYEPAGVTYKPGTRVVMKTTAAGSGLHFNWLVTVSTETGDFTYDLSKSAGIKGFESHDKNGKMKISVTTSPGPNGEYTSELIFDNIIHAEYGIFVSCLVSNEYGSKETDRAFMFPSLSGLPLPEVELKAEVDIRMGKVLKLACNVYEPDGFSYDGIEYVWYETPDGDKGSGVKIDYEDNPVLVPDHFNCGTYHYYCMFFITKNGESYYYETGVSDVRIYAPETNVAYSCDRYELNVGQTATVKATATVAPSSDKGELSYQWMRGNNNIIGTFTEIKGATSDTLTVTGAEKAGRTYYCCIVTNTVDGAKFSSMSSDAVIVEIRSTGVRSAEFIQTPSDVSADEGEDAAFSAKASDAVKYEWVRVDGGKNEKLENGKNGVKSGADGETLVITALKELNGSIYVCNIYGADGNSVSSSPATLTVIEKTAAPSLPAITEQPQSETLGLDGEAKLRVTAVSPEGGELVYRWYISDTGTYGDIRATENGFDDTYTPEKTPGVKYYCVAVRNHVGKADSDPVYSDFARIEYTEDTSGAKTETDTPAGTESADSSAPAVDGQSAATDTASGAVSQESGENGTNGLVIALCVIIIALLLALIGAGVFIIIKFIIKKNK